MDDYLRLRQICLVAPKQELEPTAADLGAIFGLEICHRDPRVERFGVTNVLFVAGTTFIEIVAPMKSETAAGRFLERTGGRGGYIAIFECLDPVDYRDHAAEIGVTTAYEIDRPGVYRAVQLHPRDCRATMLEFDRTYGGESLTGAYSPAGEGWQKYMDTSTTRGITGIEATSPRPDDLADHWGAILRRPVHRSEGVPTIAVDGAEVRIGQSGESERERLDAILVDVVDPEAVMAEAARRGRSVGSDGIDLAGMIFRLS